MKLFRTLSFRSIGTRFILMAIGMVVVVFGGLGIFTAWQNAKTVRASLNSKAASVADLAALTGAEYLGTFNFIALDHLVDDLVKDKEVAFAAFYNAEKSKVNKHAVPESRAGLYVVDRELKDAEGNVIGAFSIGYRQDAVSRALTENIALVAAGLLLGILVFSLGIAWASRRIIVSPINRFCEFAAGVSRGELSRTLEVMSKDELGVLADSLNAMVGNLSQMVQQVQRTAREVESVSEDLSGASGRVADAARVQADGVNTTSTAITQISSSVHSVSQDVDSLSEAASATASSMLEMAASVEEVALNSESLALSVDEVTSSISEMAHSVKQVGEGVVTLLQVATTTASSVMEMDSSIKQVEKNAGDTAAISEEVRQDAAVGQQAVEATITGIGEIRQSFGITAEVITTLSEKARDIGAILSVIDDVANQTNLLALNAAIIAAQAGEHGKGFAVVADEIKELASRTSDSTREIVRVINAVQEETHRAVEAMTQAETRIAEGERLSHQSGEALAKIVSGAQRATAEVESIARSTMEQARGSQMIRDAMEQVAAMVHQIAFATEEQTRGSELIIAAVERMRDLTSQVRTSTHEQSKVGGFVARSTESITDMIKQIKRACDEQNQGSGQIVSAMEDIQLSTHGNMDATRLVGEAVSRLTLQTELLKKEVAAFKV